MISNIPIFRAKKIDSDEYIVGYLKNCTDTGLGIFWIQTDDFIDYKIDISTLSIHFSDMIDSQGNKIFASLQEDGKGGDICYVRDFSYGDLQGAARYEDNHFRIHRKGKAMGISLKCRDIKVIGIQE